MSICVVEKCLTGMTESAQQALFRRIRRKIGAPVLTVELVDEQIEECICQAIEKYSSNINNWALENRMAEMLGLPNNEDVTLKYVANSLYMEKSMSKHPSELIGGGVNTTRELKTDGIALTAGTQNYSIPAGREVEEIMWYTPSFINLYGLSPFSNNGIDFYEFGASFAGNSLYSVVPVFDTILTAQAMELRNKVRGSEFSYTIHAGSGGTRNLRLYPIPTKNQGSDSSTYNQLGAGTPGTMFYRYYDRIGTDGNPQLSGLTANPQGLGDTGKTGNGLVSGPADAPLYNIAFDDLNDVGKNWVKEYAEALSKELLGIGIRGKFSGELPIPDATVTMNSADLITNGRADQDRLLDQLKTTLENLSLKKILEDRAAMQEAVNKSLQSVPLGLYWG